MNFKIFGISALLKCLIILLALSLIKNCVSAAEENGSRISSSLQLNAEFKKTQQRMMQILQEPSFSWILKKLAKSHGKPTYNTHPPIEDAINSSEETNKDNLPKESFDPEDRRSLLHANHAIAHLMYQGDMLLNKQQADYFYGSKTNDLTVKKENKRKKRLAVSTGASFPMNRWDPDVPISYYFAPSIPSKTRDIIREALNIWQNNTCITFQEGGTTIPRVEFFEGPGCFSEVGKDVSGKGSQYVSIGFMCSFFAPIAHEIGHVLGMIHTQARSDRDDYVNIEYKNVPAGMEDQFEKETNKTTEIDIPYDYASIMHYTSYNQQTGKVIIKAKDTKYQQTMGNTYGPIFTDFLQINRQYNCVDFCLKSPKKVCFNKGIRNPKNCSQCVCPNGFGGDDCSKRAGGEGGAPIDCGQILSATIDYQTLHGEVNAKEEGQLRQAGCHWHIRAPAGQRVEIVMNSTSGKCSNECLYGAIEIKFDDLSGGNREPNLSRGGVRLCCPSHVQNIDSITSTGELVIISDYSQQGPRTFELKYRAVPATTKQRLMFPKSMESLNQNVLIADNSAEYREKKRKSSDVSEDFDFSSAATPINGSWNPCADYSNQCELLESSLKYSCEDQSNSSFFLITCPLTCGLCPPNLQTTTDASKKETFRLEYQPVMYYYNCVNYAPKCENYTSHCSNGQVAQICPKSCGVCGDDESTTQSSIDRVENRNRTDGKTATNERGGQSKKEEEQNDEEGVQGDNEADDSNDQTNKNDNSQGINKGNICVDTLSSCQQDRKLCFQKKTQEAMASLCSRTCGQCGKKRAALPSGDSNETTASQEGDDDTEDENASGNDDQENSEDGNTGPHKRTGRRGRGNDGSDGQTNTMGTRNSVIPSASNFPVAPTAECNSDQRCIGWNRRGICTISFMAPLRNKYCKRFCGLC